MTDKPFEIAQPLAPERLAVTYDASKLGFETTDELKDFADVLGQERALEAIRFGAAIRRPGYNLFLLGAEGTGKQSTILKLLREKAAAEPTPDDWVYVNRFAVPYKPNALSLPPGRGREFAEAMRHFVEDVRASVPTVFENEENQKRLQAIQDEFQQKQEEAFEQLREHAAEKNIALIRTPMGFGFAPTVDGEVIKPDAFERLPDAERKRIESDIEALQEELQNIIKQIPRWDRERREAIRRLNTEITAFAIGASIEQVREQFKDLDEVLEHLEAVRNDLIENFHTMMAAEQASVQMQRQGQVEAAPQGDLGVFDRYMVNPIVDHGDGDGAPVICEDNPTMPNLIGRVEHISRFGALVTDFSLIKAGAMHRANGGYLVIDARKLLMQPFSWEALKRALKGEHIVIESPGQMLSLISTISLEPEPIPLDIKIALIGDRLLYYLLSIYDPEFSELFKIEVDFDDEMDRDASGEQGFARLIATIVRHEELRRLDAGAVARVMERSIRLVADTKKLTLHMRSVVDLLGEADHFAALDGVDTITSSHVQRAIEAQIRRADRIREKSQEAIARDIILIDTEGAKIGQVNGLSVLQLGGFAFGRPTRITARVRVGAGKVIDIEREVELGGAIHSKGVLILSGYLASRYAVDTPLSLSATLVFEQSYGGVEGDSASSAELYALLSALAEVPLRQDLAVTGSVNQYGEVQAIGGVNEKIEGFFDICRKRGLTGTQGVLIPAANVDHLMLRRDVIEAVEAGQFQIYPVATIDQGIALLTGIDAGHPDQSGTFPGDSINGKVERRLIGFAAARRRFMKEDIGAKKEG